MQKIVSVSLDPSLLYTRGLLLAQCGVAVRSATPDEALTLLESCECDLLVLCHSIRDRDLHRLYNAARACAHNIKILAVQSPRYVCPPTLDIDVRFPRDDGPHLLMQAVESLLGEVEDRPLNRSPHRAQPIPFPDWQTVEGIQRLAPEESGTTSAECTPDCPCKTIAASKAFSH